MFENEPDKYQMQTWTFPYIDSLRLCRNGTNWSLVGIGTFIADISPLFGELLVNAIIATRIKGNSLQYEYVTGKIYARPKELPTQSVDWWLDN